MKTKAWKFASALLCVLVALSITACMTKSESGAAASGLAFKAGTYTAQAEGRNGPVEVAVSFSKHSIDKVEVVKHAEDSGDQR